MGEQCKSQRMREQGTRTAVRDIVYNHDAVGTTVVSGGDGPETFLTCQKYCVSAVRIGSLEQTCCIPLESEVSDVLVFMAYC